MHAESVRFEESPARASLSDQPIPPGGVPRALRHAAEGSGLDPISELYNEALRFATEGHLKPAKERLQMLLTMCPEDGEAALLLAKVQVAGQKWQDALGTLDVAKTCGMEVPEMLRISVEENLRADSAIEEDQRNARMAREQGEIKALRQEARRLRSENAQLLGRTGELETETRKWAWATAGVSTMAILFLLVNLLFGGGGSGDAVAAVDNDFDAAPVATETTGPEGIADVAAPAAPAQSVAERAAGALAAAPTLDGTTLEVVVQDGTAYLSGVVPTFRHRKDAEGLLIAVGGVDAVDADGVEVSARTRGAAHVVASGDNLSKIAYDYYGDASQAKALLKANKKTLRGRSNLSIGQEVVIPAIE